MSLVFTFFVVTNDGKDVSLSTTNIYQAKRDAGNMRAKRLYVRNPASGEVAMLPF